MELSCCFSFFDTLSGNLEAKALSEHPSQAKSQAIWALLSWHDDCGHKAALVLVLLSNEVEAGDSPRLLVLFHAPFSVFALRYIINEGVITICEGCGQFSLSYSLTSIKIVSLHMLSQLPTSLKKDHHQLPFPCHITICLVLPLTSYYKNPLFSKVCMHKYIHINRRTQLWKCWAKLECFFIAGPLRTFNVLISISWHKHNMPHFQIYLAIETFFSRTFSVVHTLKNSHPNYS